MRLNLKYFFLQFFLIFCLFFAFTGGAFLIGWEQLKGFRDLYRVLSIVFVVIAAITARHFYIKDKNLFCRLEPARSIQRFFALPPLLSSGILALLYFITQFSYQMVMHAGLETALWDFGFYDQVVWNTAHGNFLITSVRGGLHLFCEHFKPMLALLSVVYLPGNSSALLLAVFTLITSSSIALTYWAAKTATRSHSVSLMLALCVLFYLPMRNGITFLLHTQAMADPFLLVGFILAANKRLKTAILSFCLAMMCKENISMDVLGIGLFLISRKEKTGWFISALALLFLAAFVLIIDPHFRYPYHFIQKWDFYAHFKTPTLELWKRVLSPNPLVFLFLIFAPFLFLPFKCKGWVWLLGPSLALRLLSAMPGFRIITAHYTAGLNALIIIATAYGLATFNGSNKPKRKNRFRGAEFFENQNAVSVLLLLSVFSFSGTPQLFKMDKFLTEASQTEYQSAVSVLEHVPAQYSVLTNERTAGHLSHRPYLYVFYSMFPHAPLEEAAASPDLIIEDSERINDRERAAVAEFIKGGYRLIFQTGFIKIYANPSVQISPELIAQWTSFKGAPAIPYRDMIRLWYRYAVTAGTLFLIAFLLFESRKIHSL